MILNEQLAVVVDPKLSNDDVVHGSRHLLIGVVIARLSEVYVNVADRNDAKSTNMKLRTCINLQLIISY